MMERMLAFAVSALIAVSFAPSSTPANGRGTSAVIVDTDMGLDDVRAVFAILADSTLTVRAFVTVEGSASTGRGTDNLIGILESAGIEEMTVYRGRRYPDSAPPPWRETANTLAGKSFPPPRIITAREATAERLLDLIATEPLHYLALGPLGNLALLETEHPGAIGRIASIWLPASIDGNRVEAWNFSFDRKSAALVMRCARDVVLVDTRVERELEAQNLFERVEGVSAAGRWIGDLRSGTNGHQLVCDELASLAIARPDLIERGAARYRLVSTLETGFRLDPAKDGNIRIARFTDAAAAADALVRLWERPTGHDHAETQHEAIDAAALLRTFHGHLGPYVVLGYRMGRIALEELDSTGHFDLSVTVHSELSPPRSCLIDGIQLGSGCTLGKRNIEVRETTGPAYATFENERGELATIRLRRTVPRLVDELIRDAGVETAGSRLLETDAGELFEVQTTRRASRPAP
jgi:formylmethanofuran dehydrogenase subunit E